MGAYSFQIKRLFFLLSFIVIGFLAQAQFTPQFLGGTKTHVFAKSWLSVDSAFSAPKDTVSWATVGSLAIMDTNKVFIKGADYWHLFTSAGALAQTVDTTWLSNRINQKQPLITTGSTNQYFKGTLALGDFSSDVLAVTDNTYSPLGHTHTISDVTGLQGALTSKQDQLVSGITIKTINGLSLLGSGNIDVSSGSGTGLITDVSTNFQVNSGVLNLNTVPSTYITGTKTTSYISDFTATGRTLYTGQAPITVNATSGLIGVDSVSISGLVNKSRLNWSLDSLHNLIGNGGINFTPIGSLVLNGTNLSLKGDSTTVTGKKVYVREGNTGYFSQAVTFSNTNPTPGDVPVYDTSGGGGYINRPLQQITISNCQGCVPVYDTTTKKFTLSSYAPLNFSGLQDGAFITYDAAHKQFAPFQPVINQDPSLKLMAIDPTTGLGYTRNVIVDGVGLYTSNDSVRNIGGSLNGPVDFTATAGNYMHFNGAVDNSGLSPYVFSSPGTGFGTVFGGGIGLDASLNGGSPFGLFATSSVSSQGRYGVAMFDKRRAAYVWSFDSLGRQRIVANVGTHSRLGLWDSTGKQIILGNGTQGQTLVIGASGSPVWATPSATGITDTTALHNNVANNTNTLASHTASIASLTTSVNSKQFSLNYFNVKDYGAVGDGATDNTTAYTNCLNAIAAAGGGIMYFPAGVWVGKITTPVFHNGPNWKTIIIKGEREPTPAFGTIGTFSLLNNGTILKSTSTTGAVITAAPDPSGFQNFNAITLEIHDLEVRTYDNPQINGVDAQYANQLIMENVFVSTGVYGVGASNPTNQKSGIITPAVNNAALTDIRNVTVSGYYNGIVVNEHTNADGVNIAECYNALNFQAAYHASKFSRYGAYRNTNNVTVSGLHRFTITQMNIEHANASTQTDVNNAWQVTANDINDPSNLGVGDITWAVSLGDVGIDHTFTKTGGSGINSREIGTAGSGNSILNQSTLQTGSNFFTQNGHINDILRLGTSSNPWTLYNGVIDGGNESIFFGQSTDLNINSGAYYNSGWKYSTSSTPGANLFMYQGDITFRNTAAGGATGSALTWNDRFKIAADGTIYHNNLISSGNKLIGVHADGSEYAVDPSTASNVWSQNGTSAYYSTGKVGIGTSTPGADLEVKNTNSYIAINAGSANGQSALLFQKNGTNSFQFGSDFGANGTKDFYIYNQTSARLPFYSDNNNVTTLGRASNLDTMGAFKILPDKTLMLGAYNDGASADRYLVINNGKIKTTGNIWQFNGLKTYYNSGNVGIGTSTPGAPLEVAGLSSYVAINALTTNGQSALLFQKNGTNTYQFGADFSSNGTRDFYIYNQTLSKTILYANESGDVSIGGNAFTTPAATFLGSGAIAFNSIPTAPTATAGDNTTKLATTAFVHNAISGLGGISGLTSGFIPVATSSSAIGNSSISQDASSGAGAAKIGINNASPQASLHIESGGAGTELLRASVTGTTKAKILVNGTIYSAALDDGSGEYGEVVRQAGNLTYMKSHVVSDANYTVQGNDAEIVLPTPTATRTLTLPAASTMPGMKLVIHNRGAAGQWLLSGSFIQTGANALTEDFINSGLPAGKVIVLRSMDVGSGTYKWIQMNN